jgi:tripartite-type tricarboxylate transporter receptor subunit TctC
MKEAGYPNMVVGYWGAFFVPTGTPKEVIEKLTQATITALGSDAVKQRFAADGTAPVPKGPEAVTAQIRHEHQLWEQLIKKLGIKLD